MTSHPGRTSPSNHLDTLDFDTPTRSAKSLALILFWSSHLDSCMAEIHSLALRTKFHYLQHKSREGCKKRSCPCGEVRVNGEMPEHRIRELRERKGLTQEQLGVRIGRSKSVISRLEDGSTRLDLEIAHKIAQVLDVSIADVLNITNGSAPAREYNVDDAVRYHPATSDPLSGYIDPNRYLLLVKSEVVDKVGVHLGSILVVNISDDAIRGVNALAVVVLSYRHRPDAPTVTLLRQFVPETLFITHSSKANGQSLDGAIDDVRIVGVVEHVHRRLIKGN